MLRVTLTKGLVGKKDTHIKVIRALGLRKHGSSVLHHDSPTIRGMINKVHYLVTVTEEAETDHAKQARAAKIAAKAPVKKAEPKKAVVKTEAKAKAPLKKAEPKAESKPAAKTPAKAAK